MTRAGAAAHGAVEGGALRCLVTRLVSRAVNAVRLAGLAAHRRRVARSRRVLRVLRAFQGEAVTGRCFCYLRQVEPAVFEEVVLSALEDAGMFVLRNLRYTGDGGIDGRVWIAGRAGMRCRSSVTAATSMRATSGNSALWFGRGVFAVGCSCIPDAVVRRCISIWRGNNWCW